MGYHYYGVVFGKLKATLALLHVFGILAWGHAAVWLGASNPAATRWVQAGVEAGHGDARPFVYIETRNEGRVTLRLWPAAWGHLARVRLERSGEWWRVRIGEHRSRLVRIPSAFTCTTLETLGPAIVDARINGRRVTSP